MLNHTTCATPCDAVLRFGTPAFVHAPTFVFGDDTPLPSRSEVLRRQIVAAQATRPQPGW